MQIITWALQLAGGCRRSSLLAGGCSWLSKWQQRVCLCLSLPVVSTLQDSVLKLKDVSNYQPCRGRLGAGSCVNSAEPRRQQRVLAARQLPHLLPGVKPLCAVDLDGAGSTASNLACLSPRARLILCAFMDWDNKLRSRVIRRWFCCWRSSFDSKPRCRVAGVHCKDWGSSWAHGTLCCGLWHCWDAFPWSYCKTASKHHSKLLLGSTAPCTSPNPSAEQGAPKFCRNRLSCDCKINFRAKIVTAAENCGNKWKTNC